MSLRDRTVGFRAGAAMQAAAKYAGAFVGLAVTMVLARLLTPEQFGAVAVVSVFVGLFSVLSNMGVNAAVIQYRELTEEDCSALLSFTFLAGLVLAVVFCGLSFLVAAVYGDPEYIPLMCLASASVVFGSANMVPDGMLVRDRKFPAIGVRTLAVAVASGVVGVVLAFLGFGVYSLVASSVFSSAVTLVWNLVASRLKFGNWRFRAQLRLVGKFSGYQFISQLAQYLIRNLDNLVVGYALGPAALGFYDKAYKLAKYPIDYVPAAVLPAMKSFFSSLQGDVDEMYKAFVGIQKALSISGAFTSIFCMFAADEIVSVFFGSQWGESILPFRVLSASIAFQMVNFTVFSVLEGLKRTDLLLRHVIVNGAVTLGLILAGVLTGDLVVVAACVSLGFAFSTVPFVHFVIRRGFGRLVGAYLRLFVPELVASAALCALYAVTLPLMSDCGVMFSLAVKLVGGLVAYAALMLSMGQGKYLTAFLRKRDVGPDVGKVCGR